MIKYLCLFLTFLVPLSLADNQTSWIRINQVGYLTKSIKVAVLISKDHINPNKFFIKDALTESILYESDNIKAFGDVWSFKSTFRLDFSDMNNSGSYFIECDGIRSPIFKIDNDVYNGTADFLLQYMRQQRCGYNPFLKDSCNTKDGFIIYHP